MKLAYLRPLYPSVLHPFILSTISEFDDTANMKSPSPFLLLLLSYSFHINQASSQSTATVSIYSNVAFTSQRLCALECILCGYGTYGQHDCLAAALDCNSPLQNSCYCRTDLQPAAVSYVASCVSSACMNTLDVNSAVGIYTQYCATADQTSTFVFSSATHAATTSGGASSSIVATSTSLSIVLSTITAANGQYSTTLVTVTPTTGNSEIQSTPSTAATTSSSNSDNLESIIGEAIGGMLVLGVIAAVITWLILRERRRKRLVDTAVPPASTPIGPTFPSPGGHPPGHPSGGLKDSPKLRSSRGNSVAAAFPVANPVDSRAGLIPVIPRTAAPAVSNGGGPPRYTEVGGSERLEMQGTGRARWEIQG